ncbi:eukaryotic translation initiation factor 5C [Gigaspora rosea]|uniref:Eukaryotic translation initiation factor 5C n=2 Tax=Gigasporaceae TaxID=36753 RepID=A0A397VB76_9GLOM|nr:eukaryotic translation initiation factor 5C [Gigaspora rosea]CAG8529394.1 4352_t:CDS:2 [Gigaspora rosea]
MSATHNGNSKGLPALHGVKIKTRKSLQKAQAKYEPTVFREGILKTLNNAQPGDFDDIYQQLDIAGNTLEYRKYGETLFEILLTGGVLAPGGTILDDGAPRSPFSIFSAEDNIESVKKHVDVFNKLIGRRYKYLQRSFEETIKNLLQYINKWRTDENNKLATAIGLFVSGQLININVLTVLFKEHLVKEGLSLQFVTAVFKAYLSEQNIDHLGSSLKKAGMDNKLMEFFPPNKRDEEYFARYFEAEDMKQLVEYHNQKQKNSMKEQTIDHVKEMLKSENTPAEVITYLKHQMKEGGWQESDFVKVVWESMMQAVDWGSRSEQIEAQALRQVKQCSTILSAFSTNPKTELALIQKVQTYCYEDTKLMKHFRQIVQILYNEDVVSESAILYWFEKGAVNSGKTVFLKQMEPFVQWLKTVDSESEED